MNEPSNLYSYTCVKDYAYEETHPFHYGILKSTSSRSSSDINCDPIIDEDIHSRHSYLFEDGPPWKEDLNSPIYKGDENNNYKSYQYQITSTDEINQKAVALFNFIPENDNEVGLKEGQIIWISYRHGQGWLVAEDPTTGENGLVPEQYVEILFEDAHRQESQQSIKEEEEDNIHDLPQPFLPEILQSHNGNHSDWVDTDDESNDNDNEKENGKQQQEEEEHEKRRNERVSLKDNKLQKLTENLSLDEK